MVRYLTLLFIFAALGLLTLITTNAVLDPFRIYHDPVVPMAYSHIERYRVPGLINESLYRNKDTDTVLIGTSMSDNTDPEILAREMKKDKVLKLVLSGGLPPEHRLVMDYALSSGQVKTALWELHAPYFAQEEYSLNDKEALVFSPWKYFPTYLYDRLYLNDFSYLLSSDSFKNFKKLRKDLRKGKDNLQGWAINDGGTQNAFDAWNAPANKAEIKKQILNRGQPEECLPVHYPAVEMIIDYATRHAEVDFQFFIPPVHFSARAVQDRCAFENTLAGHRHLASRIFALDNARVFAYGDREDIVLPFSNYKDNGHYMPEINTRFMTALARGQGEITPDNIDRYFDRVRDIYETGMARSDIDMPVSVKE